MSPTFTFLCLLRINNPMISSNNAITKIKNAGAFDTISENRILYNSRSEASPI